MKTAIQFGAGNIGRGFMGQLFREAGYETCFVEYDKELVAKLNAAGKYPLRLLDAYSKKEIDLVIDNYKAVATEDQDKVSDFFAQADVAGTAVGVRNLEGITSLVAAGIKKRRVVNDAPVDIYLCENIYGASEILKGVTNFKAEVERKLYTHNLGHAAMGYLGYLKGYTYVDEPFHDDFLLGIFNGALEETTKALLMMYPDDIKENEHREIREDVIIRFGNPMLMDPLTRVAADPLRKLGNGDRIIGSAKLCMDYGIATKNIEYICGAAFCYDYTDDPKAVELQKIIKSQGIEAAVKQVSGVDPSSGLGRGIIRSYHDLQEKRNSKSAQ